MQIQGRRRWVNDGDVPTTVSITTWKRREGRDPGDDRERLLRDPRVAHNECFMLDITNAI